MSTKVVEHRFLRSILPAKAFVAVKAGTKMWLSECQCGHKNDYWDAGGVRYMAAGEPRRLCYCPVCGKGTVQIIRKKTELEREEIP